MSCILHMVHIMSELNKRSTIYFSPEIHQALKLKAVTSQCSLSELVDIAVRESLREDKDDLAAFDDRASEKTISYEELLKDLSSHGKI